MTTATNVRMVSLTSLAKVLRSVKGAKPVTITTKTDPGKSKAHKGKCHKLSRVNGMVNWHYENSVNRQREREGLEQDFQVQPRKWGMRIAGTPLVEHKGNLYLEMKVEKVLDTSYMLADGTPCKREAVEQHLRPHRSPTNQGVTKSVILRDYRLDSITTLKMGGVQYIVS